MVAPEHPCLKLSWPSWCVSPGPSGSLARLCVLCIAHQHRRGSWNTSSRVTLRPPSPSTERVPPRCRRSASQWRPEGAAGLAAPRRAAEWRRDRRVRASLRAVSRAQGARTHQHRRGQLAIAQSSSRTHTHGADVPGGLAREAAPSPTDEHMGKHGAVVAKSKKDACSSCGAAFTQARKHAGGRKYYTSSRTLLQRVLYRLIFSNVCRFLLLLVHARQPVRGRGDLPVTMNVLLAQSLPAGDVAALAEHAELRAQLGAV